MVLKKAVEIVQNSVEPRGRTRRGNFQIQFHGYELVDVGQIQDQQNHNCDNREDTPELLFLAFIAGLLSAFAFRKSHDQFSDCVLK